MRGIQEIETEKMEKEIVRLKKETARLSLLYIIQKETDKIHTNIAIAVLSICVSFLLLYAFVV